MKNSYPSFWLKLILLAVLCSLFGCATAPGTKNSPWQNPQFVDNTAFYLKATVANGVVIAVDEDRNAKGYIELVRAVIAKVLVQPDRSPKSLEAALAGISVKELKGKYARLATANLSLAYELYWSQAVKAKLDSTVAPQLLTAILDGIDLGLTGSAPGVPVKPAAQ